MTERHQTVFLDVVYSDLVLVVHGAGSDILARFGDADVADVSFKFVGKDGFDFESSGVPDDQGRPAAQLSSGDEAL